MAVYTEISKAEVIDIASAYQLKVNAFYPVEGGVSNSNYVIDCAEGKFMLTILEDGGFEGAERLVKLLSWFEKQHFFTTRMRSTAQGEKVLNWHSKPVFIKTFIPAKLYPELQEAQLEKVGSALAKLHQINPPAFLPKIHIYEQKRFAEVIGAGIDPDYEIWLSKKLKTFNGHLAIDAPQGIVHADLFADNILFIENREPVIIDFEEACYHFLAFDLGMTIIGLCSKGDDINYKHVKVLLNGYQKVRPLRNIEKEYLQFFIIYGAIRTSNWRYWKYHIENPNPERKNKHREMMSIAEKVEQIPTQTFINLALK